jgi:hypothetical protein
MKNPVVVLVKGAKSSEDKTKNPFSVDYQIKLIKKIEPHAEIMVASTGYLPAIMEQLREKGMEPDAVYAGADRISGYKKQIDDANSKLPDEYKYHVEFKETERVTSATTVRNAIRSNNIDEFKRNMPKELWGEFDTMKKLLGEKINVGIKSFEEWLSEEDEMEKDDEKDVNKSDQVAKKDSPIGDGKVAKRKMNDDEDDDEEDDEEELEEEEDKEKEKDDEDDDEEDDEEELEEDDELDDEDDEEDDEDDEEEEKDKRKRTNED